MTPGLLHTERHFEFVANGTLQTVAPLFGARAERAWAPDWDPRFAWPAPAGDHEGMVFVTAHPHGTAIWINTELNPEDGRYQYVYVIPDKLVTRVRVTLSPQQLRTRVSVEYQRTALNAGASAVVRQMAEHDAAAGPQWERQINDYLASR